MKFTIRIEKKYIPWWMYVFFSTLCPNVLLGQFALLFFVGYSFISFINHPNTRWKKWLPYIVSEGLFLSFSIIQCLGIAESSYDALQMCRTVAICLLFDVAFICFCSSDYDNKVLKIYINATFIGFLVCLILYGYTIGNEAVYGGRFASAVTLSLGPIILYGHSSTALAAIASNAIVISTMLYWKVKRKLALFYLCFFTGIILLTQSRKNLLFVLFAFFVIPYFYYGRKLSKGKIKIIVTALILCAIAIIAVIKIPFLYNSFGERLLAVFGNIFDFGIDESSFGESSIRTRSELIVKAENAIQERPIFGWGLNNFSAVINNGGYYAHNNFLEILVSGGVIGFILFYLKYLFIFKNLYKGVKNKSAYSSIIYKTSFIAFLIYFILEWWQITYMFRFIYILPMLLLHFSWNSELNKKEYRREIENEYTSEQSKICI